jgi:hypothetical protein
VRTGFAKKDMRIQGANALSRRTMDVSFEQNAACCARGGPAAREMSRCLLNIAARSLPRLTLRGVSLVSKDAVG